jgi:hypothetical protein
MLRKAFTVRRQYGFDLVKYFLSVDAEKKHGSELRKIILRPTGIKELRKLLNDRGYRHHTIFPSLSSIKDSILETQSLFGRGQHQYANTGPGFMHKIVVRDGRFVFEE